MSTPYTEIFKKANILFEDAPLLSRLTDDEYTEFLELFLSKTKSVYFKKCKKDLADVDNTLKQFNQNLSDEEQWICAQGVMLVWLERQLYKEEKLRDKMGTKDYSFFSPANMIQKLINLVNDARTQLRDMEIDYTFNSFTGFK